MTFFALLLACGRELTADPATQPDAGPGAGDGGADGAPIGSDGRCRVDAPFGDPRHLQDWLPGTSFISARRGADRRWYVSIEDNPGGSPQKGHIAVYREEGTALVPDDPAFIAPLVAADAGANDEQMALSPNGLRLMFHSDRLDGDRKFRLFYAERADLDAAFSRPAFVEVDLTTESNRSYEDPYLGPDERIAFSFQAGNEETVGSGTLAVRGDGGRYLDGPGAIGPLDSIQENGHPVLSADGEEIFFSSERLAADADVPAKGQVWHARRAGGTFGAPEKVEALAFADSSEYPTYLTPDRCTLYIVRKHTDEKKRIYVAERMR